MFNGHIPKIKRTYLVNKVGAIKTSGSLTDDASGVVNLTNGQLGIINQSSSANLTGGVKIPLGDFVDGSVSTTYVPQIKIVQGTSNSATPPSDNRPGIKRAFESSALIESDGELKIVIKAARAAAHSVWGVRGISASDLTTYGARIAFRSEHHDIFASDSTASVPAYPVYYTSPDYTQLIADGVLASAAQATDHLIKNLVVMINKNSAGLTGASPLAIGNELVLALAMKVAGQASGTLTVNTAANVDTVVIQGVTLTEAIDYVTTGSNDATALSIAVAINASSGLNDKGVIASVTGAVVTIMGPGAAANAYTLATTGGGAAVSGATLSGGVGLGVTGMTAGSAVSIETVNSGGSSLTKSYGFSAEEIDSLKTAFSSSTSIGSIILADVSTATGTPTVPAAEADSLSLLGLDRVLFAADDRSKSTKTRLDLGLVSGFAASVIALEGSKAKEGVGYPRPIKLGYEETEARRNGDVQYRGPGMAKIDYPSDVLDLPGNVDQVIITHSSSNHNGLAKRSVSLQETIVLTAASVDSDGMSVNTPSASSVTLGSSTAAIATAVEAWARQNGVKVQVRYDA